MNIQTVRDLKGLHESALALSTFDDAIRDVLNNKLTNEKKRVISSFFLKPSNAYELCHSIKIYLLTHMDHFGLHLNKGLIEEYLKCTPTEKDVKYITRDIEESVSIFFHRYRLNQKKEAHVTQVLLSSLVDSKSNMIGIDMIVRLIIRLVPDIREYIIELKELIGRLLYIHVCNSFISKKYVFNMHVSAYTIEEFIDLINKIRS